MKKTTIFQHLFLTILVATSSITTLVAMNQIKPGFYCIDAPAPQYKKEWKRWWQALELKFKGDHELIENFIKAVCAFHRVSEEHICNKTVQDYLNVDNGVVFKLGVRDFVYEPVVPMCSDDYGYFVNLARGRFIELDNAEWGFKDYFKKFEIAPDYFTTGSPTAVTDSEEDIFKMEDVAGCSSQGYFCNDIDKQFLVHLFLATATSKMRHELYSLIQDAEQAAV